MTRESVSERAELVRAVAIHRDRAAFAELFDIYAPRLQRFLLNGATDAARAEELVQEVMLTVWKRADTYDAARASVDSWIFTIARNRRIDTIRRQRLAIPDACVDANAEPADDRPSTEALVATAERADAIRSALIELPESQAEVLRSMYFEDKSLSAIADETGLPLGTVKSRARLAVGRLRAALNGHLA